MLEAFGVGLVVLAAIVVLGLFYFYLAIRRRPRTALGAQSPLVKSFITSRSPQDAVEAIIGFAQMAGYHIGLTDGAHCRLVLEEHSHGHRHGYTFPVYITRQHDESVLVEVSVKGRVGPFSPVIAFKHHRCFNGIKSAIGA